MNGRVCRCGRRLVRVYGGGALGVAPVAAFWRDTDGATVMGPLVNGGSWRHQDNTAACEGDNDG